MKKIMTSLAISILAILCTFVLWGCSETTVTLDPVTGEVSDYCLVTVIDGEGGGNYEIGVNVKVSPTTPDGKQFMYWSVNGAAVSSNEDYVFVVESDITLTANFADAVDLTPPTE